MLPRNLADQIKEIPAKVKSKTIPPTVFECAALSLDVYYQASDPTKPPLPSGWIRFLDSGVNPDGYFGACYLHFKKPKKIDNVIFAHRGTVLNEFGCIESNVEIFLGTLLNKYPHQVKSTIKFLQRCSEEFM